MARLFGTDGVRGPAGTVLTAELALRLGRAAVLGGVAPDPERLARPRLLVVRDTRESGPMLEAAFAAGAAASGADVHLAGVLPTPGAALLVRSLGFDLAAVVSASHNPFADNGIKLFGPDGRKLPDALEERVAALVEEESPDGAWGTDIGQVTPLLGATEDHLRALDERFADLDLRGRRIALDCAHGATARVAPEAFRRRGAEVVVIGDAPDGRNINAGVGSTHPEALQRLVVEQGCELGFAFDGDGDRLLAVDHEGRASDGDELLALIALHLRESGRLAGGVAVTVMSNYGFHAAMDAAGIEVATTPVGDRHVMAALAERGWNLGGEQSGHLIETGFVPSGDGVAAALLVLEALAGDRLGDRRAMERLPQVLVNVPVADRDGAMADAGLATAVAAADAALAGRGRVLVRASGTEQLVRVMAEAPTEDEARAVVDGLVAAVPGRVA
ncbi:Phosphoglucosamine mutase [Patulibacter medicamentivorans]|uniref:Phosphoglucosamine mutase n=1 Tax=Patulibacter medicamentivorans TaxID=1097667 RepID=H0E0G1_9ACTN|nr:phosphoglucosamine mutase [Patulibacter medicamentivorans]EHN12822.1 Phosphoglucosamine mutase [Patulibacter medicamentivorans]